ncbi:MAG TPA: VacB/RNase II family 3'-5' exoribonuclease, partial [Sphingomonadales bacterium]
MRFIEESPTPVGKREIARAFHIHGDQRIRLKAMLKELSDAGLLHRGRGRSVLKSGDLPKVTVVTVTGRDSEGHAIVRPDNWTDGAAVPLILLKEEDGRPSLGLGDRALVKIGKLGAGVFEARVMRRMEAASPAFLGQITRADDGWRILPVDKRARSEFKVADEHLMGAEPGELVLAEEIRGKQRLYGLRNARVRERLGDLNAPRSISLIAIHAHGIPVEFDPAAIREAKAAKPVPLGDRVDLRHLPIITVDPSDARDHDDAVWAEADTDPANPGGWHVVVAIADVAHYVRPGSALDREAWRRGNSAYFPDRVVPMLPEELSTDLCSLKPGVDRPVMAVHLWFDQDGNKIRHRFERAMIRSVANLAYERFQAAYDGMTDEVTGPLLEPVIKPLYGAYFALLKARQRRGALELVMPERKVRLDDAGRVVEIREHQPLDAHRLIENFMIAANVAAAETLEQAGEPCMYRVHEEPSPEKIMALRDFLATLDLKLARGQRLTPKAFNQVLEKVAGTPQEHVVNEVVLRSQSQARYDPENLGHFGLGLKRYAHFTSPIRRYADLLVHRALISAGRFGKDGLTAEERKRFSDTAEHISMTERRAMVAERESIDRYLASYLSERVGAEFPARISAATRFGLFIT